MPELTVTAPLANLAPAVRFQQLDQFLNLHRARNLNPQDQMTEIGLQARLLLELARLIFILSQEPELFLFCRKIRRLLLDAPSARWISGGQIDPT
jgi:hypothetical protein